MSKILEKAQQPLRLFAIAISALLFAYLVWRAGPSKLWGNLRTLGWGLITVLSLAGVSHLAKTWAWRLTLGDDKHKISFFRLVGLRLGAEASGQLGILGQTFGDSIRISRLGTEIPLANGLASVTLDRGLYVVTGSIVTIAGILAALPVLSFSRALRIYAALFVILLTLFLLFTLLAIRKRWPVFSWCLRPLGHVSFFRNWVKSEFPLIQSVENTLLDFHHKSPTAFWASFFLNFMAQCLAVGEVCLVLWLLGVKIGVLGALVIEAMTKLVNVIGSCNPGNIGTYEAGIMLIGKMFGLSSASGLALALARRLRALFWTAVGGTWLVLLTRPNRRQDAVGSAGVGTAENNLGGERNPAGTHRTGCEVAVAIFLGGVETNAKQLPPSLARVGSLSIALRAIFVAQKAGCTRIIIVADHLTRLIAQRELSTTKRLPCSVQWIETAGGASLAGALRLIVNRVNSQRLVVIGGNATYHPSLIRKAIEWNDEGPMALMSGETPVGIYTLPADAIYEYAEQHATQVNTLRELNASLMAMHSFVCLEVAEDLWQRVNSEEDRRSAERKLDRWLVKPTDGMYAQFNRRISIPISRQLIKLPITANMVSVFTLGVGIASATYFALGGYWNTLLGAFLCLFASILDGCDGEVARLKCLESDFGCWLETVCDYLFYLFLLVGMTVGLWRRSGTNRYLLWGAFLLFGAIASFLAAGWQRHRLAPGRPEQLLKIWHTHAKGRPSNPLLYFSRHTEFIVRRCFFPYPLLLFALLGIMNVAFVLSVIAANLVWPIALYSSRSFARPRGSAVSNPAAST